MFKYSSIIGRGINYRLRKYQMKFRLGFPNKCIRKKDQILYYKTVGFVFMEHITVIKKVTVKGIKFDLVYAIFGYLKKPHSS